MKKDCIVVLPANSRQHTILHRLIECSMSKVSANEALCCNITLATLDNQNKKKCYENSDLSVQFAAYIGGRVMAMNDKTLKSATLQ